MRRKEGRKEGHSPWKEPKRLDVLQECTVATETTFVPTVGEVLQIRDTTILLVRYISTKNFR